MNQGDVVFARYELHEQIGSGATSVVWRATDRLLQQTVALKRISFAALGAEQAQLTRDRALREARLAAQLRGHPHVVAVYDVLVDQSDIWLVMEYLPSRSLREILNAEGPLDPVRVARIGVDLAEALAAAHSHGIEHRDVKPGNVLISQDGTVKLADFGISHLTGDAHLTSTGISGTPAYLAPEVVGTGQSSPASDIFSLGSTLYAAVEGLPPFGIDDNTFRLLNVVRTGIIRPPSCAGPLAALLLRLLQLNPATRPDAATARDLLARLADPTASDGIGARQPASPGPRRWWPPRRRTAVAGGVLFSVAVILVGVVIGASLLTAPSDEVQPPSVAGLPTNAGDPRDADPCALINLDSLRPFGQPRFTTPPYLESCQATITATGNAETYLQVTLHRPGDSPAELGADSRQVNGLTVVRKDREGIAGGTGCMDWLAPADQPWWATITTFPYRERSADLCAVTEAATAAAADMLARNGGVPADPGRNAGYLLALADACDLLDDTTLTTIPGLDPNKIFPGYADWSCAWGTRGDGTRIELRFGLRAEFDGLGDPIAPIGGRIAYGPGQDGNCDIYVAHQPAATGSGVNEIFHLSVTTALPEGEVCALAVRLATAVEEKLSRNPRNIDPCALVNLDSLRPFGEPRFTTGPWLQSCQAVVDTADGDEVELRVILDDPEPITDLRGTPQQRGEKTVVHNGVLRYWGTDDACRNYLVPATDQPMIIIYALTHDDTPIDLCAMTEAGTTAAIEAFDRNGGFSYIPDRTAMYSHAHNDACALPDDATLGKVPGLDRVDGSPGYANWACHWYTGEGDGVSLYFRLEAELSSFYEDLPSTIIAGKKAFLESKEGERCTAYVVHRSTPAFIETLEVHVEIPLAADELCTLATTLATAAEKQLPAGNP